jgi:hypothetical protein
LIKSAREGEEKMGKLEDLENIVDTLSVLINEVENEDLKNQLSDYQTEFLIEKEELETNLKAMQAEYEAEYRRESALMRM